ncbi:Enoyl-CoA hydratase [Candidatus Burkholderia verschuerenii]|uniref:Enoyl-CoA hydratase n=1 Tax=Candidatus Burkholderia verschuerenii TaxID=242163 RepID=A0A0L0MI02_9BURK|nr:enoyl-CoA hydratase-related protein [Candidatus Burkholderia verschuerenii]KND61930.1 Enoyl-CoA hydratase [Candidatus Burkholderia verschuerenii]
MKASALLGGLAVLPVSASPQTRQSSNKMNRATLEDVPLSSGAKLTIERRDSIALIGINRPDIQNRIDPETYLALARALYTFDNDSSLRAAVVFGHGENFSQGIDVTAFAPVIASGQPFLPELEHESHDPLEKASPDRLSKPLIAVVHGDTWNMAHEIFLAADIRVAANNTNFGQDENTHGRFPGGGSTVRFVREAGWGNAMRYMLTGEHWNADEAYRMGLVQHVANSASNALSVGLDIAKRISACAPLGVRTTLESAHLAIVPYETPALSKLDAQFGQLFHTRDFAEGRKADAEARKPEFKGY